MTTTQQCRRRPARTQPTGRHTSPRWSSPQEHQKRTVAKFDLYLDGRFLLSTDRRLHFHHAKADLERLFQAASDKLDLGPLPPFPAVPEPPIDVDMDQPELDDTENSDRMWWTWMMQASGLNLGPP